MGVKAGQVRSALALGFETRRVRSLGLILIFLVLRLEIILAVTVLVHEMADCYRVRAFAKALVM